MKNKKAIEMSFNWIFAMIAGAVILFIAIYGAGKFIDTQEKVLYTETAAKLISLLDPMETGLASGKSAEVNFKKQSKIYLDCNDRSKGVFGRQTIAFSEQTFGKEYGEKSERVLIENKYVFAEDIIEGRSMHLFSKPFFMPFKVADIIVLSAGDYCFYEAPEEIESSLGDLNLENIYFVNSSDKCEGTSVCFDSSNCDILVSTSDKYVKKEDGGKLYYEGNLIYAAIFSSSDIYECNVRRLKSRFNELAKIYIDKIGVIERKGCESNIGSLLQLMSGEVEDSRDLRNLFNEADMIDSINRRAKSGCSLY